MNEELQRDENCGCVETLKKDFLASVRHQRGLISQFVFRFRNDCDKLAASCGIFEIKVQDMLALWILIVVPLSFEISTISSKILHEHQVMKERNFGNDIDYWGIIGRNSLELKVLPIHIFA